MVTNQMLSNAQGAYNRQTTYGNAARLGLLAAGLGAAIRGGSGLFQLGSRNLRPAARPAVSAPMVIDVPTKQEVEDEEEFKQAATKQAEGGWFSEGGWLSGLNPGNYMPSGEDVSNFFAGNSASKPGNWWASMPLQVGAGAGGLYGGWKLADMMMDSRRKAQLKSEVDKAKEEYEKALQGGSKLGQALNSLYDSMEKDANLSDIGGPALGLATLLGLAGGAGAGYLSYNMTKARDPARLKEKAKKQYRVQQHRKHPSPIFARPVPLAPSTNESAPSEDELEGEPLDKIAMKDPSYSPEHPEECCMSCGARQERGDNGSCNRCGGDFDAGRKKQASFGLLMTDIPQPKPPQPSIPLNPVSPAGKPPVSPNKPRPS